MSYIGSVHHSKKGINIRQQEQEAEKSHLQRQTQAESKLEMGSSINWPIFSCKTPPSILTQKVPTTGVQVFKYLSQGSIFLMASTTGSVAIFKTKLYQMILAATEKVNNSHLMYHKPVFLDLDSE